MKICWFGIYTKDYPRNKILLDGLMLNGVEIVECNVGWRQKNRYLSLWEKLRKLKNDYDIIYCAYPATIPTMLAKFISNKPVVMDAFYSMFDAVVCDRKEIKWYHPRAIKLLLLDWLSIMAADYVITDTEEHKKYWSTWFFVKSKKIHPIYLGVDNSIYYPIVQDKKNDYFQLHFHGNYIPLHGVIKIAEAARILKIDSSIRFRLIGSGRDSEVVKNYIDKYNLTNIEQVGRITPNELNLFLNKADLVLGIFGDTLKARRVIPNKIYEGMAVKKPVITMDSPAVREVFSENELYLVKNDGESLANAIKTLQLDQQLMQKLAINGYNRVIKDFTPKPIGKDLVKIFEEIINKK